MNGDSVQENGYDKDENSIEYHEEYANGDGTGDGEEEEEKDDEKEEFLKCNGGGGIILNHFVGWYFFYILRLFNSMLRVLHVIFVDQF